MKKLFRGGIALALLAILMATFTIKLNAASEYIFYDNDELDICQEVDDTSKIQSNSSSGGGSNSEQWYNTGTSLPHAVDYSNFDLIKFVRRGDIVYEDSGFFGLTGHIALVEGVYYDDNYEQWYIRLIEAVSDGVTRGLLTPTRFNEKEVEIYRLLDANDEIIDGAIDFMISQLGKKYEIAVHKNNSPDNEDWYCSELVWAAFYHQGIYLDEDDNDQFGSIVFPREIKKYDHANLIMHYQYETYCIPINNQLHKVSCNNVETELLHEYIYQNEVYDSCICCGKTNMLYFDNNIGIHCKSATEEDTINLLNNQKFIYTIDIGCQIQYCIQAQSYKDVEILIYNDNMDLIEISSSIYVNSKYTSYTYPLLEKGRYYVLIKYKDVYSSGNVQFTIYPYTNTVEDISSKQCVNVLPHLHENKNEFKICTRTEGLYLLELDAYINGLSVDPNSSIVIKNSSGDVVAKYSNANVYLNASSVSGSNNILFYANQWSYYYIYIEVASLNYSTLNLNISRLDEFLENTINVTSDYNRTFMMPLGDSVNILSLEYAGSYEITLDYLGNLNPNMKFIILKTNANNEFEHYATYSYSELCSSVIIEEDIKQVKKLMLCVFNNETNGRLSINIDRAIDENHFTLVTDKSYDQSGSEVHLNNGTLGGTIITKGFTRLCYLGDDAPNKQSRLNYYWYSSNNNVVTISNYGTITAVGVGTATIQAVYKNDTSKIATLTIQVVEDTNNDIVYLQYGMDVRVSGTLTGTEVSSGMGSAIDASINPTVTMHRGYTRLICLDDDSPNSSVQAFNWSVVNVAENTGMVSVSEFGTITAERSGTVVIEGTYKYNSRFKVRIVITVL